MPGDVSALDLTMIRQFSLRWCPHSRGKNKFTVKSSWETSGPTQECRIKDLRTSGLRSLSPLERLTIGKRSVFLSLSVESGDLNQALKDFGRNPRQIMMYMDTYVPSVIAKGRMVGIVSLTLVLPTKVTQTVRLT